jgi:hypothetical protein
LKLSDFKVCKSIAGLCKSEEEWGKQTVLVVDFEVSNFKSQKEAGAQWMSPSIMAVVLLSTDEKFNDLLNVASQFPEKST